MRTGEIALERINAGLAVLSITGEHDLNTAPELRRRLGKLIGGDDPIVVDLSRATFVDSSILGTVLGAMRRAREVGTGFAVLHQNGDEGVARVLDITGLRSELPVHGDRDEAIAAAKASVGQAAAS